MRVHELGGRKAVGHRVRLEGCFGREKVGICQARRFLKFAHFEDFLFCMDPGGTLGVLQKLSRVKLCVLQIRVTFDSRRLFLHERVQLHFLAGEGHEIRMHLLPDVLLDFLLPLLSVPLDHFQVELAVAGLHAHRVNSSPADDLQHFFPGLLGKLGHF